MKNSIQIRMLTGRLLRPFIIFFGIGKAIANLGGVLIYQRYLQPNDFLKWNRELGHKNLRVFPKRKTYLVCYKSDRLSSFRITDL